MKNLLDLYEQFASLLKEKVQQAQGDIYLDEYEPADSEKIALLEQHVGKLPDELLYFWQHLPFVLNGNITNPIEEDDIYFGFDFYKIDFILRDLPDFRAHTQYLDKENDGFLIQLHEQGIPLSFEEPHLVYFLPNGKIYLRLYDGNSPLEPIADSFTEFFEHYLASGCFRSHVFEYYWGLVKDIVPIQIPLEENKWINFYKKLYNYYFI